MDRASALEASGLHSIPGPAGWNQIRSADGLGLEMPGVPLAERADFRFRRETVPRTFVDLDIERGLGAYLLHAYEAHSLSEAEREALRVAPQELMW